MKRYTIWLKTTAILQILTALIHSSSFLSKPVAANETEETLFNLITTYHRDMGAGFNPTYSDLFTAVSACFALLYLLGGLINWYLLAKNADISIMKGITTINLIVFAITAVIMYLFAFLPPIILTALVFLTLIVSRITFPSPSNPNVE